MNEFSGDIAAMLEVALIGGVPGLTCTSLYWFKYREEGYFEHPSIMQMEQQ